MSLSTLMRTGGPAAGTTPVVFVDRESRRESTVGTLLERAARVASALRDLGIDPHDRIAAQLTNREEAVVLQYAALMLGAVLVPMVPVFGPQEVATMLADARPKAFVTQSRWNKFD